MVIGRPVSIHTIITDFINLFVSTGPFFFLISFAKICFACQFNRLYFTFIDKD